MLEGASYLALLGVAMPLKYLAGMPLAVRITGSIHGALFILFLIALIQAWSDRSWPIKNAAIAFAASLLPFGPFLIDSRLKRLEPEAPAQATP